MHSFKMSKPSTLCLATLALTANACGITEDLRNADQASQQATPDTITLDAGPTSETPDPSTVPPHCVPSDGAVPGDGVVLLSARAKRAPKGGGMAPPITPVPGGPAPQFGAPPLQPGMGPETKDTCGPASAALPGAPTDPGVVRQCFAGADDPTPQATIERVLESIDDVNYVHVRLTFNPHFVDNSYGRTAIGWERSKNGTHTFKDLVGSDHAELLFTNKAGAVAMHLKTDYISVDANRPSGYGTLGVLGGDGDIFVGQASHVLAAVTSFDRNLNACGYGGYTVDSPATDASYTPNALAPNWDYRVVYELWIAEAAFGSSGFGGVGIEYVHASPSKTGSNTIIVDETPCPPNPPETPEPPGDTDPPGGNPPENPDPPGDTDPPGDMDPPGDVDPPGDLPPCPPGYVPETPDPNQPDAGPTPENPDPQPDAGPTPERPDLQ